MATIIRLNESITDKSAPRIRHLVTSDDFSGSGNLVGTSTTAALGGTPMEWVGAAEGFTRESGTLRINPPSRGQEAKLLGLPENLAVTYKVVELPPNGRLLLSVRGINGFANRVIMRLESTGALSIENTVDGTTQSLGSVSGVRPGDTVTLTAIGTALTAYINGAPSLNAVTTVVTPGDFMFSTYPEIDAAIDDLVIEKF